MAIFFVYPPLMWVGEGVKTLISTFLIEHWTKKWVTEVRSKILTPLETTGGKTFSLEGFEKKCFLKFKTLRRVIYIPLEGFRYLSRGVYNSTGGIQKSFQWVYISTGGIQISFKGVYNPTGGIQKSFQGVYKSTGGI